MPSYAHEFKDFVSTQDPNKINDSIASSGSSHIHYGLSNPVMRNFVKTWSAQHPQLTYDDWQATLTDLYQGESIDEICLAGFMLGKYTAFRNQIPLATLDMWINQLNGWREIDTTCQSNYTAKDILQRWDVWHPFLLDLAQRDTIQHRRASLVLLVKPLRDSTDERLISTALSNVDSLKHENDKLITKAISWILREAIKRHRVRVGEYVQNNSESLPAIAIREFTKKYETGKK